MAAWGASPNGPHLRVRVHDRLRVPGGGAHGLRGLLRERLTVCKAIRDRHDGRRATHPTSSSAQHYARSMSNYAYLLALSGFRYSAHDAVLTRSQGSPERLRLLLRGGLGLGRRPSPDRGRARRLRARRARAAEGEQGGRRRPRTHIRRPRRRAHAADHPENPGLARHGEHVAVMGSDDRLPRLDDQELGLIPVAAEEAHE